jgi:protein-disulfide isomerase
MSKEAKIMTAILIAVVGGMVGLFMLANTGSSVAPVGDKTKITRDSSHKTGTGSIQLVEFGDYQCPACGSAHPSIKQLMQENDGKLTLYFRNFPLSQHKNALAAAEAAEAAGDQGKYWEMHDKLYETQKDWSDLADPTDTFVGYAKALSLDSDKLKSAITGKKFQTIIDQDTADGTALGIDATPTFYFNGVRYTGDFSYASLNAQLQTLLKK